MEDTWAKVKDRLLRLRLALASVLFALFPWEPGFRWLWEAAADAADALIQAFISLTIGGFCVIIGILILTGRIKIGKTWTRLIFGFGFVFVGFAVILGWTSGWF
jgi:hypothetical protein